MALGADEGLLEYRATILDPVHGAIHVNGAEFALLQTPFLRRLHEIKQLGFLHLVYPQATHSRLAHSLGVMHLAGKIAEKAVENSKVPLTEGYEGRRAFVAVARLAGLLHDIGHPPYSHAVEEALVSILSGADDPHLPPYVNEALANVRSAAEKALHSSRKPHELFAEKFLESLGSHVRESLPHASILDPLLGGVQAVLVGEEDAGFPQELLQPLGLRPEAALVIRSIISNSIVDADRLDYLIRDAHNTGVVFGHIDYNRIIDNVTVVEGEQGPCLALKDKALPTLDDVFDARFKMYRSVYYHHKNYAFTIAASYVLAFLLANWDRVAYPGLRSCGPSTLLLDPGRLAACIKGRVTYYDDPEFDYSVRALAALGGVEARWGLALLDRRDLLPVSLVKRPEALALRMVEAAKRLASPERLADVIDRLRDALSKLQDTRIRASLQEKLAELVARRVGVDPDLVLVNVEARSISRFNLDETRLCSEDGGPLTSSLYLGLIIEVAATPLVYVYAFSHDEKTHKLVYKGREEIRREAEELLLREVSEMLSEPLRRRGGPPRGSSGPGGRRA